MSEYLYTDFDRPTGAFLLFAHVVDRHYGKGGYHSVNIASFNGTQRALTSQFRLGSAARGVESRYQVDSGNQRSTADRLQGLYKGARSFIQANVRMVSLDVSHALR
jgi:hypothetical protein